MSTIYVMEAANLFCGDDDPTASKHLTLTELQLTPATRRSRSVTLATSSTISRIAMVTILAAQGRNPQT
jgi:hypothetical protein